MDNSPVIDLTSDDCEKVSGGNSVLGRRKAKNTGNSIHHGKKRRKAPPTAPIAIDLDEELSLLPQSLTFRVSGRPRPQARPRFTSKGVVYIPSQKHVKAFRRTIQGSLPAMLLRGPLSLKTKFAFRRPKGAQPGVDDRYVVGRPDIDNLTKLVMDAMNNHVYKDDSQVVVLSSSKVYDDDE